MPQPFKFYVIGPESTGKSSLCAALAQHYNTLWCPEYAREYLTGLGRDYTPADLLLMAKGQLAAEAAAAQACAAHWAQQQQTGPALFFADTDMLVMRVWSEYVFGSCDPFILSALAQQEGHGYLLCNTDLPWAPDPLREYPEEGPRKELFALYKTLLQDQDKPWAIVSGQGQHRTQAAIQQIEAWMASLRVSTKP